MMNILKKSSSHASVVDGALILSLPDAVSPVVWRWDLEQARSAALEVSENGSQYILRLKTADGKSHDIAPFASRETAISALMSASRAMESAQGRTKAANSAGGTSADATKWVIAILGTAAVAGLYFYLSTITPQTATPYRAAATAVTDSSDPAQSSGVPVSADDLLSGQN